MGSVILGFSTADWAKWVNVGFMCFAIFFLILVSYELADTKTRLELKIQQYDKEMARLEKSERKI